MARRRRKDVADQRVGREDEGPPASYDGRRWWRATGKEAASLLWQWSDVRRAYLRGYHAMDLIHEAIYEGRPVGRRLGTAAMDFLRAQSKASSYLNILQSMVDTVVSRVGKHRTMPVIGCDDAEYSEKLYARRASRVMRRKLGTPQIERMMPLMMRDAVIRGDGFAEAIRVGGDITPEKFPRSELVFDDGEPRHNGWPRTLARVRLMDRDNLAAMFPDERKRIMDLPAASRDVWAPYDYDAPIDPDQVEVIRGWRLPSHPGSGDGKRLTAVRDAGKPLDERLWDRMRFPIARIQWTPALRGFLGIGLVQQLAGSQNKVNELWTDHQEALYWGSALKIFKPRGSNVNNNHLRARHPAVIEYDGAKPDYEAPNPASTQAMDSLRWLISEMYEISGISQMNAAAKSTLGPNASGKALDTMDDIQSDRHSQFDMQYSMARVDIGQCTLDEAKDLAKDAKTADDIKLATWIDEIDWRKFDFDGGSYHLRIEGENFIPGTRAGKLDALGDMAKIQGLLDNPILVASLFDEPDISAANRHLLGPIRALQAVAEMLGDLSVPLSDCVPTPYMLSPPGLALSVIKGEHDNAFSERADERYLSRYRWFLTMLEGEEKRSAPTPVPPPDMSAGGLPPGAGMPPTGAAAMPGPPGPMGPPGPAGFPDPMAGGTAQLAAGMNPMLPPGVA